MRDEVLKENICQPQTCTEMAGWRGELHTETSWFWERMAAYTHHSSTEIARRRGAVMLNGHLSWMSATNWENWVQILLRLNFSGSAPVYLTLLSLWRWDALAIKWKTQPTTCQACKKSVWGLGKDCDVFRLSHKLRELASIERMTV